MCYYYTCHKSSCKSPETYVEVQDVLGTCYLSSSKEKKGMGRNSWNTATFVTQAILGFMC